MPKAVLHYGNLSCSSQTPDRTSSTARSLFLSFFLASPCHFAVLCLTLDKLLQLAFISAELNGTASYTMCLTCSFFFFTFKYTPLLRLLFYLFLLLWPHIGDSWKAHDPQSGYTFSEELLLIQSFFVLMDLCSWLCLLKCCPLKFSLLNYMLFFSSLLIFAHITLHSSPVLQCAYSSFLPTVTSKCNIYTP